MDISDSFDYQQPQQEHQQATTPLQASAFGGQDADAPEQMSTNYDVPIYDVPIGCTNAPASEQQSQTSSTQQQQEQQQQIQINSSDADLDVDSLLLQQFSCLGTTDHEDLINQFRTLLNHETTKDSAKFFLEMSNWNLQAAVGCYLDYFNGQQLPTMKIVLEARPSEGQQAWRIRNEGTESWPTGCYIISPGQDKKIEVPALRSGECCDIIADIPPTYPTMCIWRLCTPYGTFFGDAIVMAGWKDSQLELSDRMSQLCATPENTATAYPNSGALEVKVVKVNME